MRLKLQHKPTFSAAVVITIPGENKLPAINIVFRHKTASAIQDWLNRGDADGADDVEIFDEVIESWTGLADSADNDLPYSKEALREMFEIFPASKIDVLNAYLNQMRRARGKN